MTCYLLIVQANRSMFCCFKYTPNYLSISKLKSSIEKNNKKNQFKWKIGKPKKKPSAFKMFVLLQLCKNSNDNEIERVDEMSWHAYAYAVGKLENICVCVCVYFERHRKEAFRVIMETDMPTRFSKYTTNSTRSEWSAINW